jgi:hypothetical protein
VEGSYEHGSKSWDFIEEREIVPEVSFPMLLYCSIHFKKTTDIHDVLKQYLPSGVHVNNILKPKIGKRIVPRQWPKFHVHRLSTWHTSNLNAALSRTERCTASLTLIIASKLLCAKSQKSISKSVKSGSRGGHSTGPNHPTRLLVLRRKTWRCSDNEAERQPSGTRCVPPQCLAAAVV